MKVMWAALEAYARKYADIGITPSDRDAETLVRALIREENVEPAPSDDDVTRYANDFLQMVAVAGEAMPKPVQGSSY